MLARVHQATAGKVPLIGIGGIDSGETALAKIEAGATLIQLYTGLIYEGPGLVAAHQGPSGPRRARGRRRRDRRPGRAQGAEAWAAKPL